MYIEADITDPSASSVPQHLKVKSNGRDRKKQVSAISQVKNNRDITHLLYIETDIWDPSASNLVNITKAVGDPKKKSSSQKSRVKNIPRKETFIVQRG